MTVTTPAIPLDALLLDLGEVIARLDWRRHILPARLDIALGDRCWAAQILADPLHRPLTGRGQTLVEALEHPHATTKTLSWRKVRR